MKTRGGAPRLELGTSAVAGFRECSGLSFNTDPVEYREGTDVPLHVRKLTGLRKFANLVLKRGFTANTDLFKWYKTVQATQLRIPAFERDHRYIKTIAVSVFNTRERTSWHFGPLRLTFRVLCNLEPINSREVFIEVDDQVHYWVDNPLFIFDDTMFHRSINDVDHVRYCLFMDIVRPNYWQKGFDFAVNAARVISGSFKRLFYKNWSFIR